ncbi:uncharacterized protein NECHADRAFT_94592 [Fusarium vanettenii 77-13-4]|uniref:PLD phosphodiesterase domain-containing protein n=1 Tax=Fusarium vanettenii (strain ATCC MYA-4622 / CBS 123669 / FGSC 9596 / NRRL 45880 / 77-13-4) TaxID=660122 RepID=C7Z9Y3_FUSV7|nr:uncharacterized protein NECHADRAFT_94592 [Fusarium vanettenii 77-13-4]EEU39179.1 hypothetical protein NECHADRAFT_94592 [Fusarium vanettenii 77-13-4]
MTGSRQDVPDPGSDMDEDEALRYAIALSLQEQENQDQQTSPQVPPASASSASSSRRNGTGSGGASFGLLSLDRKKMEQERLQRLAKRRRSPLDEDDDDVVEVPPPKRRTPVEPSRSLPGPWSPSSPPFPGGVVKRTWARGYPRTSEDIKIEEVFQKDRLELAVLSSYQWDDEWLLSKIDLRRTKLLLVASAADESQKREMQSNTPPGIRFCFPAMNGPGAMHSKLQLLKYPDYLRVVVPTANLVPYDWGETGVMENMVFLIDLPKLEASVDHQPTHFSTELGRFLSETGVGAGMVSSLSNYDFSRTKHLGFVYTIPGGHVGDSLKRIGYCGLGNSVASLGLATDDPVEVDMVCASLGSLNYDLVGAMYNACRGDDGMAEYKSRIGRTGAAAKNKSSSPWAAKLKDRFRIYFPTDETVAQSRGGRMAAGTICVQPKWWRSPTFPTELVRDCVNTREGLLMHSKMIFVRRIPKSTEAEDGDGAGQSSAEPRLGKRRGQHEPDHHDENDDSAELNAAVLSPGWAYVGSANLSESAWGRIVKDRATGQPKMSCRNWESGVVVRVSSRNSSSSSSSGISSRGTTNSMGRANANAGSTSSTSSTSSKNRQSSAVLAAEAQARVQAGNPSGEPDKGGDTSHTQQQQVTDMGIFDGTVPVPVRVPGRRYRAGEEPWFYSGQG